MLDNEKTVELVLRAQSGDQDAKEVLTQENSPLIKSLIKRFRDKGVEYDDLFQIGFIGFLKAINNFKTEFGVKFSTYVVPMVIGEIKRFMRDDGAIKVSRALKSLNIQINRFIEQFSSKNQRKPTIEEIAKEFQVEEQDVVMAMDSARMPISLYAPLEDESGDLTVIDRVENVGVSDNMLDNLALKEMIKNLQEREKKIILLRYYFDKTQSEIAKELGISQVQVSRLENKILENFRSKLS